MSDFESFINEQALLELGLTDRIGDAVSNEVGHVGTRLKAMVGSKQAKGAIDLKNEVKDLFNKFRTYCGQQQVRLTDAKCEDLMDFAAHVLQFDVGDAKSFIYHVSGDAPHAREIDELTNAAIAFYHNGDGDHDQIEQALGQIVAFAHEAGADAADAHTALWKIARSSKQAGHDLSSVRNYVGKPIENMAMLNQLLTAFAKVRLKRGGNGSGSGSATGSMNSTDLPTTSIKVTNNQIDWSENQGKLSMFDLTGEKGFLHDAFGSKGVFALAGIPNIGHLAKDLLSASREDNDDMCEKLISKHIGNITDIDKKINIARMLLEFCTSGRELAALGHNSGVFKSSNPTINASAKLETILRTMRNGQTDEGKYNAKDVNMTLKGTFRQNINDLIGGLLIVLAQVYGGGGAPRVTRTAPAAPNPRGTKEKA